MTEAEEIQIAQSQLLRRRAELASHRTSTLESVKNLISQGKLGEAAKTAEPLRETSYWREVVKAVMSSTQLDTCPDCKGEMKVYVNEKQLTIESFCPDCAEKKHNQRQDALKHQVKSGVEVNINKILQSRGVPRRLITASVSDYSGGVKAFCDDAKGLYMHGGCGVGKSHLAVALMRERILSLEPELLHGRWQISSDRMPLFVSVPDLLLDIRSSFNANSEQTERDVINKYASIPSLILDDLGVEKNSDWVTQTLYIIIDRRNRDMRWTTITSNLSIGEIAKKLDDRIASRIAEMCTIQELTGEDRRIKGAQC